MRRLDFPARLPVGEGALGEGARLRFEPLPISGDARGHLSGVGAALRVGLWPHSPRRGASWRMERNLEPTRAPQPQGPGSCAGKTTIAIFWIPQQDVAHLDSSNAAALDSPAPRASR